MWASRGGVTWRVSCDDIYAAELRMMALFGYLPLALAGQGLHRSGPARWTNIAYGTTVLGDDQGSFACWASGNGGYDCHADRGCTRAC